ncbi:hypothetical protein HQN89_19820 [Paenibacillus frigoriresistens]|uniref:hypothetical protein n=1 Tax=Paenibacillus alginolyticus TaxID=59839 RepID=UPI001564783A|nr:hypothetical protein [Paenibacillus frigoriresistens]NRF93223.1 hypothetical protein [Paenibacillus frigoriresistens]
MNTMLPGVNKLNFLDIFRSEFGKENISVGVNEEVTITIESPMVTLLDKDVLVGIFEYGEKTELDDNIVCTIREDLLNSHVPIELDVLEGALGRLSRMRIEVNYSFNGERHKILHNLFDVQGLIDAVGKLRSVTMSLRSASIMKWLFTNDFMKLADVKCG